MICSPLDSFRSRTVQTIDVSKTKDDSLLDIPLGKEAQSRHVGVQTIDVDVEDVQVGITTVWIFR